VNSDQNGNAAVRLVVPTTAATQVATLRATDVTSGNSVVAQFTIAQFINGNSVLSVIPTGVTTFKGPDTQTCSAGASATFYVFGGTPPYTIATNFPQAVSITGNPVLRSGGGFTITTNGVCFTGLTFAITDAAGRTLLTPPTADNVLGTAAPAPGPLAVFPQKGYTLTCTTSTTLPFTVAGGTAPYSVQVDQAHVDSWQVNDAPVSASGGQFTLKATGATAPTGTTSVTIIDSSKTTQSVTVPVTCQ
jgi:hypothetical protein